MISQDVILKRVFFWSVVLMVTSIIWFSVMVRTTDFLANQENYIKWTREQSSPSINYTQIFGPNYTFEDKGDFMTYDKFFRKPVLVRWYHYFFFSVFSIAWLTLGENLLRYYYLKKEVKNDNHIL